MAPRTNSRRRSCARFAAIALALSLLAATPVALAVPAAVDEYSLGATAGPREDLAPDVQAESSGDNTADLSPAPGTLGVLGEDARAESPLEAVGTGQAILALLGVVLLAGLALLYPRGRPDA